MLHFRTLEQFRKKKIENWVFVKRKFVSPLFLRDLNHEWWWLLFCSPEFPEIFIAGLKMLTISAAAAVPRKLPLNQITRPICRGERDIEVLDRLKFCGLAHSFANLTTRSFEKMGGCYNFRGMKLRRKKKNIFWNHTTKNIVREM